MAGYGKKDTNNSEIGSWILIVLMLALFWPVGLFLLFRKLTENNRPASHGRSAPTGRTYVQPGTQGVHQEERPVVRRRTEVRQPGTQGVSTGMGAARKVQRRVPAEQEHLRLNRGKSMMIVGGVIAGVFGLGTASAILEMVESLFWGGNPIWYLEDVFFPLGFCCAGFVVLAVGMSRNKKARRFRKYLALIGHQTSIWVETLAQAMPVSVHTACDDLQEMLDEGLLPIGYLDMSTGRLILSDEGIQEEKPEPKPEPAQGEDDRTLAQIRAVNDAIEDAAMSEKIDRIEEITRKIFEYQKKNPEKGGQLRSFLNYYLPTTLKILNSYAQLEEQGVEGENISAAKVRIEGMMDKVVEGFEKQLDKLFENTAMDITTDVKVLEQMLEKDGLSQKGSGLTLGG